MKNASSHNWQDRLAAGGIHLALSAVIAGLAALLVFWIWYPSPYAEIAGGRDLFLILVAVDVVLGPLITLIIFNRAKPVTELRRDLVIVVVIQFAALAYGLWTMFVARPVHTVFEYDRLRVVHAVEILPETLAMLPQGISAMPITGPTMLALRPFKNADESYQATLAALNGVPLSAQPDLWQPYPLGKSEVLKAAKPVAELMNKYPASRNEIERVLLAAGVSSPSSLVYLPLVTRNASWTAFLDANTAEIVTAMPLDAF